MAEYRLPFRGVAEEFEVQLSGTIFSARISWNAECGTWMLDLFDVASNVYVLTGLAVVSGVDLLAQHAYLGFVGGLVAHVDGDENAAPTYTDLGTQANIYYVTP